MFFSWLKRRRRRRILEGPFPSGWRAALERVRLYGTLSDAERRSLERLTRVLVAEKHWEGCAGVTITDEIRVVVSAQAAFLLLGLDHDFFANVSSILIYPDTFVVPGRRLDGSGIVDEAGTPVLGLANRQGPIVLAWASVLRGVTDPRDGRNVVLHEFAHKLDMLDRFADGAPPLGTRSQARAWARVMREEFDHLRERARAGKGSFLDRYGATNPAEFFAVATEYFFEKPASMGRKHPELYAVLRDYYRQDPATRSGY